MTKLKCIMECYSVGNCFIGLVKSLWNNSMYTFEQINYKWQIIGKGGAIGWWSYPYGQIFQSHEAETFFTLGPKMFHYP